MLFFEQTGLNFAEKILVIFKPVFLFGSIKQNMLK